MPKKVKGNVVLLTLPEHVNADEFVRKLLPAGAAHFCLHMCTLSCDDVLSFLQQTLARHGGNIYRSQYVLLGKPGEKLNPKITRKESE